MWLALDQDLGDGKAIERVLPRLEAVLQFTRDLQRCLTSVGVDGMAGALGIYRCLRSVLDAIPAAEIERMLAEIAGLERELATLTQRLEDVRRLKRLVER